MLEMAGADAFFLHEEAPAVHMHTVKIVVVDPAHAHDEIDLARVREGALRVTPYQAAFRRRPLRVPLGLGHPLWLETLELDPEYHIRHAVLDSGCGEGALDDMVGRIASEPLDERRPLWQLFFVEGLPHGHVAYVTKIHHAVADGVASAELASRLFQPGPEATALPPKPPAWSDPVPTRTSLAARALLRGIVRQREIPSLLWRSARMMRLGFDRWRRGLPMPPSAFEGPMTRFNRPLTPNRVYTHASLTLADLQQVKKAFGCTVNDVYLALVGGAVRDYLELHGALPKKPLTAAVPVSIRRPSDDPAFGNATATWFTSTRSDLADPVERLLAVAESTLAARELFALRDPRLAMDWLDHWSLRRLYLDGFQTLTGWLLRRPSFNLIVSNVHGPRQALYSNGARVVGLRSMGPLARQQGLNFTAWSYLDQFNVGIHACREHVPDVRALAASLAPALEELKRAAERRSARRA